MIRGSSDVTRAVLLRVVVNKDRMDAKFSAYPYRTSLPLANLTKSNCTAGTTLFERENQIVVKKSGEAIAKRAGPGQIAYSH
jgi:hypothetical protein